MCFGCPSVAMAVGGIPEVVEDGVSGRLVAFGDVDAAAHAVDELLDDPTRRAEIGANARRRAEDLFSARVIVPRYEALYQRVKLSPGSSRRSAARCSLPGLPAPLLTRRRGR